MPTREPAPHFAPSPQVHPRLASVAALVSTGPVCVQCGQATEADDEAIPVAGNGVLHDRCYTTWLASREPRKTR
jgi:hypothetical protein